MWPTSVIATETFPLYPEPKTSRVEIPTDLIDPPTPIIAVTEAPTKGAYPTPSEDPRETIIPPLGNWFWFMSPSVFISCPLDEVIPVKTTDDTPTLSE